MKKLSLIIAMLTGLTSCNEIRKFFVSCDEWSVPGYTTFSSSTTTVTGQGRKESVSTSIVENKLHQINLLPISSSQDLSLDVSKLPEDLGDYTNSSAMYAGLLKFTPEESGAYSIWVDVKTWVDIEDSNGRTVNASDAEEFCTKNGEAYSKVISFSLEKGESYILGFFRASEQSLKALLHSN